MDKEVIIDIENPKDNDLISRQMVLNLVADYDLSMGQVVRSIRALPSVKQEPKWIPVIEKLPEDEQEVLITYKINVKYHVWSAIWDELHGRFYDKEYRSYISLNYVTAWMPLPPYYKPQERSDKE